MMRERSEANASRHAPDRSGRIVVVAAVAYGVVLAAMAWNRGVFNYHTETDFVGSFGLEAARLLRGEPLDIDFHPPWYPVNLAVAYAILRDWFAAGIAVSILASIVTIVTSASLWRRVLGAGAGLGAAAALMASPIFTHFSAQTTSDVISLALHSSAMLATWVAARRRTLPSGLLAGVLIGLAVLTRTNNVVLFALLSFFLLPPSALAPAAGQSLPSRSGHRRARLQDLWPPVAGIAVTLLAWAVFATATGAPLAPTRTYENLALTYFPPADNRISGDARLAAAAEFDSSLDVLLADPIHIARTYARDVATSSFILLARNSLLPFPLIAAGAIAFVALWWQRRDRRWALALLLGNLALMYLLTNLKAYEHRYYLFLLPPVGAAIGAVLASSLRAAIPPAGRAVGWIALVAAVGLAGTYTITETPRRYLDDWATDAVAAASFLRASDLPAPAVVFAQKPHLAFYAEARSDRTMPRSDGVDLLMHELRNDPSTEESGAAYLFFGASERSARSPLAALGDPSRPAPDGLTRVAHGSERGGWVLYLIDASVARPPAVP